MQNLLEMLVVNLNFIWNRYTNKGTMKILLIFKYFHIFLFIKSKVLFFIFIWKEKLTRFFKVNIFHSPYFQISAALFEAPHLKAPKLNKRWGRLLGKYGTSEKLNHIVRKFSLTISLESLVGKKWLKYGPVIFLPTYIFVDLFTDKVWQCIVSNLCSYL